MRPIPLHRRTGRVLILHGVLRSQRGCPSAAFCRGALLPAFLTSQKLDLRLCGFVWQFGHVLTAVIRIREPTPEIAHNSWALVAFAETNSVDRLLGSDAVASLKSGEGMTFTAKRIDPQLAISSTGSFGQIFQTCRDRVAQARAIALACADSKLTYQLRDR